MTKGEKILTILILFSSLVNCGVNFKVVHTESIMPKSVSMLSISGSGAPP